MWICGCGYRVCKFATPRGEQKFLASPCVTARLLYGSFVTKLVGPWQAVADVRTKTSIVRQFYTGEAMTMAERTPIALLECTSVWS